MTRLAPGIFLTVLASLVWVGAAAAQTTEQRRPPVLRSGGTYSVNQNESNKGKDEDGAKEIDEGSIVRVSTSLITVPAVVMDRNGRYIPNLKREDFLIYEDGVEQSLSYFASVERPFTVALMLDVSGSTQSQLSQIREAANTFVSRLRSSDRMMAITFDGKINVLTEAESVSAIRRSKLHIPAVTDGTVLYDAVNFALKRMAGIEGRKAIVLMTDGVDQNSVVTLKSTLNDISEQDVLIYTVQYNTLPQLPQRLSVIKNEKARRKIQEKLMKGYATSEPYLRTLAEKTGGRFYRADDLSDVGPAFEAITAELGVQYSLGYYPKKSSGAGSERGIKVRVRYPNMVVRARDSYTTSPALARE
ncbi:MAG: Ca-activated chloride channel, partial [Blastocatellia bacterium]|nr:Ca-activated chloride channel [Blastocatellia bacterium]